MNLFESFKVDFPSEKDGEGQKDKRLIIYPSDFLVPILGILGSTPACSCGVHFQYDSVDELHSYIVEN